MRKPINTFVKEYKGWPGKTVDYNVDYGDGVLHQNSCSKTEWMIMKLTDQLIEAGADETALELLKDCVSQQAREDEWMSNAGPEL